MMRHRSDCQASIIKTNRGMAQREMTELKQKQNETIKTDINNNNNHMAGNAAHTSPSRRPYEISVWN